jgi:hypothetical protein
MRRVLAFAVLVVFFSGTSFEVRASSREAQAASMLTDYRVEGSDGTGLPQPIATMPRVGEGPVSSSLISQLSGVHPGGAAQTRHRVTLSWNPGEVSITGDSVVGYNVYRCRGFSTKFFRLNAEPLTAPEYTDDRVRSGAIYYYATTAVNQAGRQSRPSNVVRVVIPYP